MGKHQPVPTSAPCKAAVFHRHIPKSLIPRHFFLCSKNLTWRDMQHLVVQTSKPAHLNANDWATNGVGRKGEGKVTQRFRL